MSRPRRERAPLPPIWRLSDEQWVMVEPVLKEHDPPAEKGPDRVDQRAVMDAMIFPLPPPVRLRPDLVRRLHHLTAT